MSYVEDERCKIIAAVIEVAPGLGEVFRLRGGLDEIRGGNGY